VSTNLKVIHLMCACLFLGNVIVSGVCAALADRTGSHEIIKFSNRMVLITDALFTATGALGVVITGHLMADRFGGDTAHGWITWSYMLFGLSGLIWACVLVPIQLRQRTLLARFDYINADYLRLSRVWKIAGAVATILPLPIIYLMVTKVA